MSYASGSRILDDDYNLFVTGAADGTPVVGANVNSVFGAGSGDVGYGQSALSAVSAGTTVTATQWTTLFNTVGQLANHQNTSITALPGLMAGDTITAIASLATSISDVHANRFNAVAQGSTYSTGGALSRTTGWQNSVTFTHTVTFGSADEMRYFFNCGGQLKLSFSRTGGSVSNKNSEWSDLLGKLGTLVWSADDATIAGVAYTAFEKKGGSGTTAVYNTGLGFHALTGTAATAIEQYADTAPYTTNFVRVQAEKGTNTITITVLMQDDADANTDEVVDGTLTSTLVAVNPSTTYLTDVWGAVTLGGSETGS